MKRLTLVLLIAVSLSLPAVIALAQSAASDSPFFVEVAPSGAGIQQFAVPLHVLDKAREDLADLRLYDANGREIPYAVRIRKGEDDSQEIEGSRFNESTIGSTASEVSIDLGENSGEHNEVEIETEGENFRRSVEIEGSDNPTNWRTLDAGDVVFSFGTASSAAHSNRISYPTSRHRYLRVRVLADTPREKQPPVITRVKVRMSRHEKAEITNWDVSVSYPQYLRHNGAPASSWTFDLGVQVPCNRLVLSVSEASFSRPFEIEVIDDPANIRLIASGELTKRRDDSGPLTIDFENEVHARKLRLVVTDHSNQPLSMLQIQAGAPLRQVFFELREPSSQPLKLYFGNPNATAPHYDFEKEWQSRPTSQPLQTAAGPLVNNPEYQPPPLPFTERVPWLIYSVLTASSVALGLILFSLARAARKANDQRPQPSEA